MEKIKEKKYTAYLLVLLVIINSGFPMFYNNDLWMIPSYIIMLLFSFFCWNNFKNRTINNSLIIYLSIFLIILFGQTLFFGENNFIKIVAFLIKIFSAYFIINLLGIIFFKVYVRLIYFFSIISLIFFIPVFVQEDIILLLKSISLVHPNSTLTGEQLHNLIIFNLNFGSKGEILRNSGPFWEPGAFSGFLLIALYFNTFFKKTILNKVNLVLIISLITTFSTAGYIGFLVLNIYYYFSQKTSIFLPIILLFLFSLLAFNNQFLTSKIGKTIDFKTFNPENRYTSNTRVGSLYLDFNDFLDYPLIGKGLIDSTRYKGSVGALNRNNGLSDFLVRFGIIGFLLYFISMFYSFYIISKKYIDSAFIAAFLGLFLVMLLGFSELYFRYVFFFCLAQYAWSKNYNYK